MTHLQQLASQLPLIDRHEWLIIVKKQEQDVKNGLVPAWQLESLEIVLTDLNRVQR